MAVQGYCGDGVTQDGVEQCDDGNATPTDCCDQCRRAAFDAVCRPVGAAPRARRTVG